jgi:hypothetical protein
MVRRSSFNSLEQTGRRWYVVRSRQGTLLESRELPPETNLKREFIASMLAWMDAGWQVGEFSSVTGTFFCDRNVERRMISFAPTDPGENPGYGAPYSGRCPTCED